MLLYRTTHGWRLETSPGAGIPVPSGVTVREDLYDYLHGLAGSGVTAQPIPGPALAPIEAQEVWAAGVTYYRSRTARMAEAETAGGAGGSFYDRVYTAERPELFMKATPHRVVGSETAVRIRRDSKWNVPEPELTLLISPGGKISGYTVGNDTSSRDIEGANPLYLPQAKVWDRCCALGPAILVTRDPLPPSTAINLHIARGGATQFSGTTTLAEMKRRPEELVAYLYREATFPGGAFLLTGTGIVPPDSFTLQPGDRVEIAIDGIGTLANTVEQLTIV